MEEKPPLVKKQERKSLIKVGIFLVVTVFCVIVLVFVLSKTRSLFGNKINLYAYFDNVNGLIVGAPVRIRGFDAGIVQGIQFTSQDKEIEDCIKKRGDQAELNKIFKDKDANPSRKIRLRVDFTIQKEYLHQIRQDSVIQLTSKGLLGDTLLDISGGTLVDEKAQDGKNNELANNQCLKSQADDSLEATVASVKKTSDDAQVVLEKVAQQLDRVLTPPLVKDVTDLVSNLTVVSKQIKQGPGLLHELLFNKQLADDTQEIVKQAKLMATQLNVTLTRVSHLVRHVEDKNMIPKLAHLVDDATQAAKSLKVMLAGFETLPKDIEPIVKQAQKAAATLVSVLNHVKQGNGSLGKFIMSDEIFEKLEQVLVALGAKADDTNYARNKAITQPPKKEK